MYLFHWARGRHLGRLSVLRIGSDRILAPVHKRRTTSQMLAAAKPVHNEGSYLGAIRRCLLFGVLCHRRADDSGCQSRHCGSLLILRTTASARISLGGSSQGTVALFA